MNARELKAVFGQRVIAFSPAFAKITGSLNAGLLLSQAVYWASVTDEKFPERRGWFYKTRKEWHDETYLTRCEQESARRILRAKGFIEEKLQGHPAQLFYRVDFENILRAVSQLAENQPTSWQETRQLDGGKPADLLAENQPAIKGTETTAETTQRENLSATRSTELLDGILFATWWESYPRKIDKPGCQRLWMALSVLDRAAAFEGLEVWSKSVEWQDKKFIPHPANFLKRRQWESKPVEEEAHGDNRRNRKAGAAVPATPGKYDHLRPEQLS